MSSSSPEEQLGALCARLDRVLARLGELEAAHGVSRDDALRWRQILVLDHISELESAVGIAQRPLTGIAANKGEVMVAAAIVPACAPPAPAVTGVDPTGSAIQQRLQKELLQRDLVHHRFVRAASVDHLCKSIVMVNTHAPAGVTGPSADPAHSRFFLVIVQYTARLHAEKLKVAVHRMCGGKHSRKHFNMRLAPEAVSDELTGFSHNAVSPIGIRTQLPVVLSHRIMQLSPDFFWIGAGEVDLKVGMSATEFVKAYGAFVIDCTYEED
eukprot:scaffold17.g460.t1